MSELDSGDSLVYHKPVLVEEVVTYLNPEPGKIYLDATFGSGGHTRAILSKEPRCKVVAFDWDSKSVDTYAPALKEEFGDRVEIIWGSFAHVYKLLKKQRILKVDGMLADFGTSQIQIIERPGFSVYRDTPLDMRMSTSHFKTTAADVVNNATGYELREIFWQLGEERYAKQIVDTIMLERKKKRISTTKELADIVVRSVPRDREQRIHPATRVFQALRIFVNKELDNIVAFLAAVPNLLNPQGRLVCISFHSLEDRIVKEFLIDRVREGRFELLTKKVVMAGEKELAENPSSRTARLRAAVFVG